MKSIDIFSSLKSKVIQGAFWTATSILGVQLLNLFTTLVLAKWLAPADFGLIALAQLVVTTVQIFRDLGLAQALIYRPDDAEEAANTAFFLVITWGVLLYVLINVVASPVALFFGEPGAKPVIQAVALSLVISSFGTVPSALLEKELEFRKKVIPEVLPVVGYVLTAIGLASAGWGVWSIVWARIGQSILTAILMWRASRWRLRLSFDRHIAIEILDYGKHIVGGSILNVVFLYIDNAYIGKLLGVTALGFYAFAFALANLPTQFITPIINKVTFPSYIKLRGDQADLSSAYLRSLRVVSMITFPATLGLATISSDLLQTLYADKWNPSIVLVQILSVYALFRSIGALPGNIFLTIGKQYLIPRLMLIYVGSVAVLLWPITRWFGTLGASLIMTGVIAVGSIIWLVLVNRYLAIPLVRFGRYLAPQFIASVAMVGWLLLLISLLQQSSLKLVFLIGNGAIMYTACILLVTKGGAYKQVADIVKTLLNISDRSQSGV